MVPVCGGLESECTLDLRSGWIIECSRDLKSLFVCGPQNPVISIFEKVVPGSIRSKVFRNWCAEVSEKVEMNCRESRGVRVE